MPVSFINITIVYLLLNVSIQSKPEIWSDFHENELTEAQLENIIENEDYDQSPLTKAYKGLCETMMAEHVFLPTSKLKYFNKGKAKIQDAICEWISNSELRYIRLMVQLNCPSFLNYNDDIDADLEYFFDNFKEEKAFKTHGIYILDNLLQSDGLNPRQRDQLEELKKEI